MKELDMKIIREIIDNARAGAKANFNRLHYKTGISKRILRKYLDVLRQAKLVREEGRKEFQEHRNMSLEYSLTPTGKTTFCRVAQDSIMVDSARIMWLTEGDSLEANAQVLGFQIKYMRLPYEVIYDRKDNSIRIEPEPREENQKS
jgi:DNA-binding HxlR family transcriptional regulator